MFAGNMARVKNNIKILKKLWRIGNNQYDGSISGGEIFPGGSLSLLLLVIIMILLISILRGMNGGCQLSKGGTHITHLLIMNGVKLCEKNNENWTCCYK